MINIELENQSAFNIQKVLTLLAGKRPVFHNEADFQHALAWEIREEYDCKIRLEKRVDIQAGKRSYLDIWVEHQGKTYGIELKYKVRNAEYIHEGETFSFLNQGAHDIGRYDVIKDLQRLEQMVERGVVDEGLMIFLTNDALYYQVPIIEKFTFDQKFRMHEGCTLTGSLEWSEHTGAGTMKGRTESIELQGSYPVKWLDYSNVGSTGLRMRMLLASIQTISSVRPQETVAMPVAIPIATTGPTERARKYIREQLKLASENGDTYCDLISGDIHRALGLQNNMPTVCQAMISIPEYPYEVLNDSPSGKTSTKKVRYFLNAEPSKF